MKTHAVAMIALGLADIISVTKATSGKIVVEQGNTTFTLIGNVDGRKKPYKIRFKEEGVKSGFKLDSEGLVKVVVVGSEKYKVVHNSEGDLVRVKNISSGSARYLKDQEMDTAEQAIQPATLGRRRRRRLYDCLDCYNMWDVMCNNGRESVCELASLGTDVLSETALGAGGTCATRSNSCATLSTATRPAKVSVNAHPPSRSPWNGLMPATLTCR